MYSTWRRHQMETLSAVLTLCAGNSPVTSEFPSQRQVTRSFGVLFHLCLNKRLSKQSRCCWFETPSCSLWRQCNGYVYCYGGVLWRITSSTPCFPLDSLHVRLCLPTAVPTWKSNYIHYKVSVEITYPLPNFKSAAVKVWEWISDLNDNFLSMWLLIHVAIMIDLYW